MTEFFEWLYDDSVGSETSISDVSDVHPMRDDTNFSLNEADADVCELESDSESFSMEIETQNEGSIGHITLDAGSDAQGT